VLRAVTAEEGVYGGPPPARYTGAILLAVLAVAVIGALLLLIGAELRRSSWRSVGHRG
jgi:hypothetical protein